MQKIKNNLSKLGFGKNIKTAFLVLALITIPLVVGFLAQEQNKRNSGEPEVLSANDVDSLVDRVGKLTYVPLDEEPEIATISDPTKFTQEFFRFAQVGDRLLIYRNARRVILYRPSTNQVIETGPLVDPTPTPAQVIEINPENETPQEPQIVITPTIAPAIEEEQELTPIPSVVE